MAAQDYDLWPAEIGTTKVTAPVTILRKQASILAQRTEGLLEAEVLTNSQASSQIVHRFVLVAPALDNYRYELFNVIHDVRLYPTQGVFQGSGTQLDNEEAFVNWLRSVFSSRETKQVIDGIMAQIT